MMSTRSASISSGECQGPEVRFDGCPTTAPADGGGASALTRNTLRPWPARTAAMHRRQGISSAPSADGAIISDRSEISQARAKARVWLLAARLPERSVSN